MAGSKWIYNWGDFDTSFWTLLIEVIQYAPLLISYYISFYSLQSFPPSWHFIVFFSKSLQTSNKCYFNLNVLGSPQGSLLFGIIPFFPLHSSRALDLPKSFATSLRTVSGLWECRWVIPYLALSPELSYQPPQPMRHRSP